jgi:hypothetical protein
MSDSKQLAAAPIRAAILALDPTQTLSVDEVAALLAAPPKPELGDFAFPCFLLARALKQAPPAIAAKLAEQLAADPDSGFAAVSALGPYINLRLDPAARTARVVSAALAATGRTADGIEVALADGYFRIVSADGDVAPEDDSGLALLTDAVAGWTARTISRAGAAARRGP